MNHKTILRPLIGTALILLVPFVLQLTIGTGADGQGFNWKLGDFVAMGALLLAAGLALELFVGRAQTTSSRVVIALVILVAFLLIWAELAVGIFGTPWAGS